MELFYPFPYSPSLTDSREHDWMVDHLFLPVFLFNPLNLGMTGVTIITSSADMCSPLVTVYALLVLCIDAIGGKIFVHDLEGPLV